MSHLENDDRIAPAILTARGLTKRYGPSRVLNDVSFEIGAHSVVSFVGENGAGKSTLLNILSGIVRPDAGGMEFIGQTYAPAGYGEALSLGLSRVFQEQSLIPNIPVYENLILGHEQYFDRAGQFIDRPAMIAAAEKIVTEAGIDVDVRRRTDAYDFSKRQSIEIARACLAPRLIAGQSRPLALLDEPTSALDRRDEEAFFALVAKLRTVGSLVFISHRLTEVLSISDRIYVLKDGELVADREARDTNEGGLHGLMVGRERDVDYYHERRQRVLAPSAPAVLSLRNLASPGEYDNISLTVHAGEIVGVGGLLDSGKSALGRGATGVDTPATGEIALADGEWTRPRIADLVRKGVGYVPSERLAEGLIPGFPVAWNITTASGGDIMAGRVGFWRKRLETTTAAKFVRDLAIASGAPRQVCSRLSGGNQQKVVLARWLSRKLSVLVLDSPTRGVDAGAKEEIYGVIRGLTDAGVGILLITDELLELIGLSNRIFIMQRGKVVADVPAPAENKPSERDLVALMLPQVGAAKPNVAPTPRLVPSDAATDYIEERAA
jgi:ribose transport system ATP-binding protein